MRDISKSGVAFFAESAIPLMTLVNFALEIPTNEGEPQTISGQGAVVRCEPLAPNMGHFEIALFFQELDADAEKSIAAFVSSKAN